MGQITDLLHFSHRFPDGINVSLSENDIRSLDDENEITGKIIFSILRSSYTKFPKVLFLNELFYVQLSQFNERFINGQSLSGLIPSSASFSDRKGQFDWYYHNLFQLLSFSQCLNDFEKICFAVKLFDELGKIDHWVGIVIELVNSEVYIHVLDPTEKGIYPLLNEAIRKIEQFCKHVSDSKDIQLLLEYPAMVDDNFNSGVACIVSISKVLDGEETNEIFLDKLEGNLLRSKYKQIISRYFPKDSYVTFNDQREISEFSSNQSVVELFEIDNGSHSSRVGDEILVDFGYIQGTFEFFMKLVTYMDMRRNTIIFSNSKNFIGVTAYFQCPSKCCSVKYQRYITGQVQLLVNLNPLHSQPSNMDERKEILNQLGQVNTSSKSYTGDLEIFRSRLVTIDQTIKELNEMNYHEILQRIKPRLKLSAISESKRQSNSEEPHEEIGTDETTTSFTPLFSDEFFSPDVFEGDEYIQIQLNHLKQKFKLEKKHLSQINSLKEKQLKELYALEQSRLSQLRESIKRRRTNISDLQADISNRFSP